MSTSASSNTVQLVAVMVGVATVQCGDGSVIEVPWSVLHDAQHQEGPLGYVYGWLLKEYSRCEYLERQGQDWQSPRRTIVAIIEEEVARKEQEARAAAAARDTDQKIREKEEREQSRRKEIAQVNAERRATTPDAEWWPIPSWEVPAEIRFDVPARNQGQIVEVSYGTFDRGEAGSADPYMQVHDHSDGSHRIYKRQRVDA